MMVTDPEIKLMSCQTILKMCFSIKTRQVIHIRNTWHSLVTLHWVNQKTPWRTDCLCVRHIKHERTSVIVNTYAEEWNVSSGNEVKEYAFCIASFWLYGFPTSVNQNGSEYPRDVFVQKQITVLEQESFLVSLKHTSQEQTSPLYLNLH